MKSQMVIWKRQWQELIETLGGKGAYTRLKIAPPAAEGELAEAEFRLGIRLPEELRTLLREGAGQAYVYWSLPDEAILPFEVSGELGWAVEQLEFFAYGEDDSDGNQRYLSFHTAGNGDELLLDLNSPSGTAVVHWAHETAEYLLLAPSFTEFIDRVTALGCVGAEEWQYPGFCGKTGLDPELPASRQWSAWLHQYLTLTLEQAQNDLNSLLLYTEMFGTDQETAEAFAQYNAEVVLRAFVGRASHEQNISNREAIICLAGEVLGQQAADFVRSLWSGAPPVAISRSSLAYLSALCLPEGEGLERVLSMLETSAQARKLSGYEANSHLKFFHSRSVLRWMEDKATYPYDGWDTLYAHSQPSPSDIIHWLGCGGVQRQIAVSALPDLLTDKGTEVFSSADLAQIRRLLEQALEEAVLKKEKQAVREALERLG
ncbi:SMI1/KNR4 family protein [Paenibacillus sp. HW567]|uniref:SMI1/KNR4 family protein n=1 Tax=Paenibacillus sp. HW567 TaxID=1034769 RepID=UPI000368FEF6|nr:SMI1/KNR4 family protein [Paenibacillus sp. HW567]